MKGPPMIELTLALLIFLAPLAYSPGPGNMVFAAIGGRFGLRASIPATTGYHLATLAVTAAVGLGFSGLARLSPALDGAVLLVLNPKAWVIIALMFSQFLPGIESPEPALVLWITAVFTLNNLLAFTLWTLAGDLLLRRFRSERGARRMNLAFGAMLAAVAVWMLVR